MIVRILGDGQYDVPDAEVGALNALDDALDRALRGDDDVAFRGALAGLLAGIRERGARLPDDALDPSDAIVPGDDAHADEVRTYLSEEGVIPG